MNDDVFVLKMKGDSMIDDRLCDGDFVVIERKAQLDRDGQQAVVLLTDGRSTLKRVYREGGLIRLQPMNKDMRPEILDAKEVEIVGVVIGVLRRYTYA